MLGCRSRREGVEGGQKKEKVGVNGEGEGEIWGGA